MIFDDVKVEDTADLCRITIPYVQPHHYGQYTVLCEVNTLLLSNSSISNCRMKLVEQSLMLLCCPTLLNINLELILGYQLENNRKDSSAC